MRLLLDTHALLWWLQGSRKLPKAWKDAIADSDNEVYVSAASILEIAIKSSLKKLTIDSKIPLDELPARCGFDDLAISGLHAAAVRELPWLHRDPFDRLLVAQAQCESMVLVSEDDAVRQYDVASLPAGP